MSTTALRVLPTPDAIGEELATRLLQRIEQARLAAGRRFLLGCPTGRTPRPVFGAMARRLAETGQDVGHVVLVMMDEYLVPDESGALTYAPGAEPWSCHHFARAEIAGPLGVPDESVWFPDPADPEAYDARIDDAGGIDFFLLASGASDGHVAFNPPGSPRASRTRIIPLSDETRRDNLQTFPAFGTLEAVPHHGISVGIDTIARSKAAAMVVWGAGKRVTLSRMLAADRYQPDWPATLIHEVAEREIVSDAEAAG
ncbi:MAG TPA: 6-phosphogluconolactonase [Gemmatimonadaceae bacterium]|nr:6-phosphogluconolactonase [Gemmatimonadaceae bacterium]